MEFPRVYSYLRFSDSRQANGSSADRQMEYASRWAAERNLILDASLSLRDEGLSAYHQRHVKQGALGTFLRAVEDGRIPSGSVLVVEALDRLSRAEPILAQAQLAQIINAGITVVTASDGREYNFKNLKKQPMDLVYSLLVMIRAHEESDTKSKRVKAAIRRQCEAWIAGTWHGYISFGRDPKWIRWAEDGRCEIVEEHAQLIRTIIAYFREGYGAQRIMAMLTAQGVSPPAGISNATRIHHIISSRTLVGEKTVQMDGETYTLEGYYPALLTEAEFAELQHLVKQRGRRHGKGEIIGIMTGMRLTYCGYCGKTMAGQNIMARNRREDGRPQNGHRRLVCLGAQTFDRCNHGSCSIVPVERALMHYCSDQMNLDALLKGCDKVSLVWPNWRSRASRQKRPRRSWTV